MRYVRSWFLLELLFFLCVSQTGIAGPSAHKASPMQSSQGKSDEYNQKYQRILEGASQAVRKGVGMLHDQVNSTASPDERNIRGFVNSTEVLTFKEIPGHMDREILEVRNRIKSIILMAATDIEQTGSSGSVRLENGKLDYLPKDAKDKYERLINAKKKNNVSVRSINLAIKMLSRLNKQLIQAAKEEKQIDRRNRLFITQAAYVYEMADIVLEILDKIGLEGKEDIQALYQDYKNKLGKRQQDMNQELRKITQSENRGSITKTYADRLREGYEHLQRANEIGLQAWEGIMNQVQKQDSWLHKMKGMRDQIELKRNAARIQLATLRDIGVLRGVNTMPFN